MTERDHLERAAISSEIDQLAYNTDHNNIEKVLEIYSEDAEYKIVYKGDVLSAVKGKANLRQSLTDFQKRYDFRFHCTGTKIIEFQEYSPIAASNTCCIVRQGNKEDQQVQTQYVEYADQWLKVGDFWYLVSRTVNIISQTSQEQA